MRLWTLGFLLPLAACASVPPVPAPLPTSPVAPPPVEVQILALNDFHGNLEPPKQAVRSRLGSGEDAFVPAGGVAYMAGALNQLREGKPHSITVAAGDLIGGSPLTSALFLDEPTILAMNMLGLELNAVGNHEFDRGSAELMRMQTGGCAKHTTREPCAVEPFPGAKFKFLAANVLKGEMEFPAGDELLFPAIAVKDFGPVQVGFIGITLKETATLVTPSGVAGLSFADEAETANRLVPQLRQAGADAIVLLIHQGAFTEGAWSDPACPGLSGDILPILAKLDPAIETVISGHTHWAYRCELPLPNGRTRLLTSAGRYGTMLTDIRLTFDPRTEALLSKRADLTVVQGEAFENARGPTPLVTSFPVYPADAGVAALVERYRLAAKPHAERVVARLTGTVSNAKDEHGASRMGELIADAQLAWTRPQNRGGAQMAFMNSGGVRGDLMPNADGSVTYGQLFALQPFGNGLVVQTLTGAQIKAMLEQGFPEGRDPTIMLPSAGVSYTYDLTRPAGDRVTSIMVNGRPIDPDASYRVVTNSFLASGGDGFSVLSDGTNRVDAGVDLDALEAYLQDRFTVPTGGRVTNRNPEPKPAA